VVAKAIHDILQSALMRGVGAQLENPRLRLSLSLVNLPGHGAGPSSREVTDGEYGHEQNHQNELLPDHANPS